MKDYMNREERKAMLRLGVSVCTVDEVVGALKSPLTPEESERLREGHKIIDTVFQQVIARMGAAFQGQLQRDLGQTEIEFITKGSYFMQEHMEAVTLDRKLVHDLVGEVALGCMGCRGKTDCPVRRVKDIVDEKPFDPESPYCPYAFELGEVEDINDL